MPAMKRLQNNKGNRFLLTEMKSDDDVVNEFLQFYGINRDDLSDESNKYLSQDRSIPEILRFIFSLYYLASLLKLMWALRVNMGEQGSGWLFLKS